MTAAYDRGGGGPDGAPALALCWDSIDHWPILLPLTAMGMLGALALGVFGLPPVDLHGPLHDVGVMDPLCGMTRAVRHFTRGNVSLAVRYNPEVLVLPASAAAVWGRWIFGWATGRWLHFAARPTLPQVAMVVVVIGGQWARQQANVELLGL